MRIELVCCDVDGTLTNGVMGDPLPGVVEAMERIRRHLPVRLVTNATSRTHAELAAKLREQKLLDAPEELFTPSMLARRVMERQGHTSGVLLADQRARRDFEWFIESEKGPAVILATEAHDMRIKELQPAFRCLIDGGPFYTMQRNRYFLLEGELVTDLGPVAAFLEYASGTRAQVLGKPSPLLFDTIAQEANVPRAAILMVGDDIEFDVSASVELGMHGVLVRTGKFRPHDEERCTPGPTAIVDDFTKLPDWLGLV